MDDIRNNIIGGLVGGLVIALAFAWLGTGAVIVAIVAFVVLLLFVPTLWRWTSASLAALWRGIQRALTGEIRHDLNDVATTLRSLDTIVKSIQRRLPADSQASEDNDEPQ